MAAIALLAWQLREFWHVVLQGNFARLLSTFRIWESAAISRHAFLPFFSESDFASRISYSHYGPAYLGFEFLWWKLGKLFGLDAATAHSALAAQWVIPIATLAALSVAGTNPWRPLLWLLVAVFVMQPSLWLGVTVFPADNSHLFAILLALWLAVASDRERLYRRETIFVTTIALSLAPLYAPIFLGALWIFAGSDLSSEMRHWRNRLWLPALVAASQILYPKLAFSWADIVHDLGSPLLFRTGLDGDRTFLTDPVQAVLFPIQGAAARPWHFWHWPVITAAVAAWLARARALPPRTGRTLMLAFCPYLYLVAFFPQYVSVHPYAVDFAVTGACSLMLLTWTARATLSWSGCEKLGALLLAAALLLNNISDLALGARLLWRAAYPGG